MLTHPLLLPIVAFAAGSALADCKKRAICTTVLALNCLGCMGGNVVTDQSQVKTDINWPAFLEQHNLHWDTFPKRWLDAPFLGNGMMGTMIMQTGEQAVRFQVGRGDVQDHRPLRYGQMKNGTMYARSRLPIGHFELRTVGKIIGGKIELDLWNAEARGVIETDKGSIAWRTLVHSDVDVILTEIEPSEGERGCRWQWQAEEAISPRLVRRGERDKIGKEYEANPAPVESQQGLTAGEILQVGDAEPPEPFH